MKSPAPLLFPALAASGQTPLATCAPVGLAPVFSPEVLPDRSVLFRCGFRRPERLPSAALYGCRILLPKKPAKDDQGVRSLTADPLPQDLYDDFLTVDGVPIADPANNLSKPGGTMTRRFVRVPGEQAGDSSDLWMRTPDWFPVCID